MFGIYILQIGIIIFLVLLNGFFVAAEFSIVKIRKTQIEIMIENGSNIAKVTKNLVENLDAYLSATQLGITLASLGLGWLGEPFIAKMLEPLLFTLGISSQAVIVSISFTIAFIIITFLHIVFGELAPKTIAIQKTSSAAIFTSIPLKVFYLIFKPIIWSLNNFSLFSLKLLGLRQESDQEIKHSLSELKILLLEGAKSGCLNKTEKSILQNTFELKDTDIQEIMIPRINVKTINIDLSIEEVKKLLVNFRHSFYPVYEEREDNIIGVVSFKDLFSTSDQNSLRNIISKPLAFPENLRLNKAVENISNHSLPLAIVIDEYGGFRGIITMKDIINHLMGKSKHTISTATQTKGASTLLILDPIITIRELNRRVGTTIPENKGFKTLSGLIQNIIGSIPKEGDSLVFQNLQIEILKIKGGKILQVKINKID